MAWDDIKNEVVSNGNVKTFTMEKLRDAHGSAKLGVNVCGEISQELARMGLGHIPEVLPTYQHEFVRVYQRGTDVGNLIDLVLNQVKKVTSSWFQNTAPVRRIMPAL